MSDKKACLNIGGTAIWEEKGPYQLYYTQHKKNHEERKELLSHSSKEGGEKMFLPVPQRVMEGKTKRFSPGGDRGPPSSRRKEDKRTSCRSGLN